MTKKKPYFIKEPFGLPFELTQKGEYRKLGANKKRYCIYAVPEGKKKMVALSPPTCFVKKKKATTFAYVETKAGMGEEYFVKDMKTKRIIA